MAWFPLWQSFHTEEHDAAIAQEGIIIKREKPYRHIKKPFRVKLSPRACTSVLTCKTSGRPHYPIVPSQIMQSNLSKYKEWGKESKLGVFAR